MDWSSANDCEPPPTLTPKTKEYQSDWMCQRIYLQTGKRLIRDLR